MTQELLDRIATLEAQLSAAASVQDAYTLPDMSGALSKAVQALLPLQPLLEDPSVSDILINGPSQVYVERAGRLELTDLKFSSDHDVFAIAQKIAAHMGRSLDGRHPMLDARLPDGSRVNVIAPPLSVDGTMISIRKFTVKPITLEGMRDNGNISNSLLEFFTVVARCKLNTLISGGTGSGKTTLLNAISQHISQNDRIVTIEDAAELRMQQPHVIRLETRPMFTSRPGEEVAVRDLVKNALRMRPDRIVVGEVRGAEAFDMLQAMNTGHEGSLTTIHANHPRDALSRLENMVHMANLNLSSRAVRGQIASAVQLVLQISRMRDGHRRVLLVSEVVGMEGDTITMQDLFTYQPRGETSDGKLIGDFKWTGITPRFLRRVAYYGETERLSAALGITLPKSPT